MPCIRPCFHISHLLSNRVFSLFLCRYLSLFSTHNSAPRTTAACRSSAKTMTTKDGCVRGTHTGPWENKNSHDGGRDWTKTSKRPPWRWRRTVRKKWTWFPRRTRRETMRRASFTTALHPGAFCMNRFSMFQMPDSCFPSNVDMIWGAYWHVSVKKEKMDNLIILKNGYS